MTAIPVASGAEAPPKPMTEDPAGVVKACAAAGDSVFLRVQVSTRKGFHLASGQASGSPLAARTESGRHHLAASGEAKPVRSGEADSPRTPLIQMCGRPPHRLMLHSITLQFIKDSL